ncbi:ead/Ea22-like family protein [Enterobacter mori]|uniref:Ead/Ea22-like family protein n=1 Tax=Enterobacter mori TaxID=539813 RepID=A0A7T0DTX3_9ENTR|nr:ead/Ea22-like family protein [Enterobacter mori]QPJ99303.1 ead/Ea22-like family protein [Enterobacter mori]
MSNIDKQKLREEFKMMQECYSDPADRERQVIYIAAEALLDELEAKGKSIDFLKDQLAQLANFNPDWDKLEAATDSLREHMAKLSSTEKRIAELEAREVVLPSTQDVHPLGPQSAKIFCEFHRSIVNRCTDEIRKVGVKVSIKGN